MSKEKHILRPRRKGSALQLLQKGAHPLQLVSKGLAIGHPVVKEILIEALGARIFVDIVKGHHLKISKIKLHKPAVVHGRIAAEGSQFAASGERAAEYRIKGNPHSLQIASHNGCLLFKSLFQRHICISVAYLFRKSHRGMTHQYYLHNANVVKVR